MIKNLRLCGRDPSFEKSCVFITVEAGKRRNLSHTTLKPWAWPPTAATCTHWWRCERSSGRSSWKWGECPLQTPCKSLPCITNAREINYVPTPTVQLHRDANKQLHRELILELWLPVPAPTAPSQRPARHLLPVWCVHRNASVRVDKPEETLTFVFFIFL